MEITFSDIPLYLDVPYSAKDQAKSVGAKWDNRRKKWFVPIGIPLEYFKDWYPQDPFAWTTLSMGMPSVGSLEIMLFEQVCWRCRVKGFAVMILIPLEKWKTLPESFSGIWKIVWLSGRPWCEINGGNVGHPKVLRKLEIFLSGHKELKGRIAAFKNRPVANGGEKLSQGCPYCDALWADIALEIAITESRDDFHSLNIIRAFPIHIFEVW